MKEERLIEACVCVCVGGGGGGGSLSNVLLKGMSVHFDEKVKSV